MRILCESGEQEVRCYARIGVGLAVTKQHNGPGYEITHVRTGLAVNPVPFPSLAQAKAEMQKLRTWDWNFDHVDQTPKRTSERGKKWADRMRHQLANAEDR